MSKVMKCNGQYVANDPCFPVCTDPRTGQCDYSGIFGGGGIGGPTDNYTVTTGDAVAGNTSTRTNISMIDPYQSITPNMLNASGGGQRQELWFNQSGGNSITVDGDKYSFEPILRWNSGCDNLDNSGDGIFPNQNCSTQPGLGGVQGLGVGALRFKNGVMQGA